MTRVLYAMRVVIALLAGAATLLTTRGIVSMSVDGPEGEAPGDWTILAVLICVLLTIPCSRIARRMYRRTRALPPNIDEVPGAAGRDARELGEDSEGFAPALTGIAVACAAAPVTEGGKAGTVVAVIGALAALAAVLVTRGRMCEARKIAARHDRIARVRGHGTRVRAEVLGVGHGSSWSYGGPVLTVEARFETPSGTRTVVETLTTAPADVPAVGGSVLVWCLDDGAEFYLEEDPESPHEPGAAERYKEAETF
ncbi:hypothetical protein [Streptomyces sp. ML-6]|uniref:hypothetical protein n=1 Tax=Streptomyces sp. ML-6 TaxID=2982693 RepID=UPI0024C0DCEF|nr:hypothetical protein [Streptomyces sp. ML-6]MDK0524743.1 hypothetical protein [Streptomyces sp. ML-6]